MYTHTHTYIYSMTVYDEYIPIVRTVPSKQDKSETQGTLFSLTRGDEEEAISVNEPKP